MKLPTFENFDNHSGQSVVRQDENVQDRFKVKMQNLELQFSPRFDNQEEVSAVSVFKSDSEFSILSPTKSFKEPL